MRFRTHLVFALLVWIIVVRLASGEVGLWGLVFAGLGGLFPDVDIPKSWVGRKIGFLSNILNFIFGHRGFFHSVFAGALIGLGIWLVLGNWYHFTFFVGYISHLFMDGMTKEGVRPFYPLKFRIKGFIKTGGILEWLVFVVLLGLVVMYVIKYMF